MFGFLRKIFRGKSEKDIRAILPIATEINRYAEEYRSLSDEDLRGKTEEFRGRIKEATRDLEEEISKLREKLKDQESLEERESTYEEIESLERDLDELIEETLWDILPEAYAAVKEVCRRLLDTSWEVTGRKILWDMVPFDVQLIGAVVLHQGKIAEMATGEGKTLVATMPAYLNALPGRGVHIDYLRDNMVGTKDDLVHRAYNYGIVDEVDSVLIDEARTPLIISGPVRSEEQKYGDMNPRVDRLVRAQQNFVTKIVAEAEQLLAEGKEQEAGVQILRAYRGLPKHKRLMKLLSEPVNKKLMQQTEVEYLRDQSRRMHEIDDELYYALDERNHTISLMDKGRELLSTAGADKDFFVLPDIGTEVSIIENDPYLSPEQKLRRKDELNKLYAERSDRIHTVQQLLRAYSLYERDDEYVVTDDGRVLIVDEFTGRVLPGRRYSDGLHQAIEAKEGVKVERDMQTLATITLQNYFRLYKKLAGMTGTAETEASEFLDIYKLDVVVIPTNKPVIRDDVDDVIYKTKREKYSALIQEIEEMRAKGRPLLVGTTSVDVSETISRMLKRKGIPHNVLNAKQHQREAEIVAHAGLGGQVTIATNMAGRGTDIKLGPSVREAEGLHIVGTERHEARRIDRQLRGRSGRQGDPGSSRFFLSLEDDLMRLFGSDRIASIMERMGLKEGDVIHHPMVTRSVERAQKKVEENNFAIRKRLLEYDNVMNHQREVIYAKRRHALLGERLRDDIYEMLEKMVDKLVDNYYRDGNIDGLREEVRRNLLVDIHFEPEQFQRLGADGVKREIYKVALDFYKRKEEQLGAEMMSTLEKMVMLQVIDEKWKDHLREMDDLKEGIHLRAYGQKDPLLEYKSEAYRMFVELLDMVEHDVLNFVFKLFPETPEQVPARRPVRAPRPEEMTLTHRSALGMGLQANREPVGGAASPQAQSRPEARPGKPQPVRVGEKIGRNAPCPCGSGKKYKHCHGR